MAAPQRALSPAEKALAREIFGAALDSSRVRIVHQEHPVSKAAVMLKRGRHFVVRGDRIFEPVNAAEGCPDYCARGPNWTAVLAHELAHVWQYQSGAMNALRYALSFNWRYEYVLEPSKDFRAYGYEQQASMVEDYVRLTHGLPARHGRGRVRADRLKALFPFGLAA